jgi:pyruvate kinase
MRKAKILATLGPASDSQAVIESMITAGVNAVRINMSHGTQEEHAATLERARAAAASLKKPLAILVDLSGPKIRTRTLKDGLPVELKPGEEFTITTRDVEGNGQIVSTNFPGLPKAVEPGTRILIDDGAIELVVESETETDIKCRVAVGGWLSERKGINLPNTPLPIPSLTEKDEIDLVWAMANNVDYIALSFVRRAEDCRLVKAKIKELNTRKMGRALLVAKIEKAEAIENLDAIIAETDGVMVARGDLGVETSVEHVPVYQKRIIEKAVANDKVRHHRNADAAVDDRQSTSDTSRSIRCRERGVGRIRRGDVVGGNCIGKLSARDGADDGQNHRCSRDGKAGRSAKAGKIFAAAIGPYESGPVQSRSLCGEGSDDREGRRLHRIRIDGATPVEHPIGTPDVRLTTSIDACNQLALIWGVQPMYHRAVQKVVDPQASIGNVTMMDLSCSVGADATAELLKGWRGHFA